MLHSLQLAALNDPNRYSRLAAIQWSGLTLSNGQHTIRIQHFSKDYVLPIKPIGLGTGDKELTSVGIHARVGTRQDTRLIMLVNKVFVRERRSVDTRFTRSVVIQEVSTLYHESLDYAMKDTVLVSCRLFVLEKLARTELSKVVACFGTLKKIERD
jgi:hypothetical protein